MSTIYDWLQGALQIIIDFLWVVFEPILEYLADFGYMITVIIDIVVKILAVMYMFIQLIVSTGIGLITTAYNFMSFNPNNIPSTTVPGVDMGVVIFESLLPTQLITTISGVLILMFYLLGGFAIVKIIGR